MVTFNPYDLPTEGVLLTESNTRAFLEDKDCGNGTLCICEDYLLWRGDIESQSFRLSYPSISLHAICRDTSSFPYQCLYCLLDSEDVLETDEENSEPSVTEVRFVPLDSNKIQQMYDAVTQCQELHPDPEISEEEEEEGENDESEANETYYSTADTLEGFYTSADDLENIQMSEEGMANLRRLQENMQIAEVENSEENHEKKNGQFDDADSMI